jgi:hypothetical protein
MLLLDMKGEDVEDKPLTADFFGQTMPAFKDETGDVFIPLRKMCDYLGLELSAQRHRILGNTVLAPSLVLFTTQVPGRYDNLRTERVLCLNIRMVPLWIATLESNRLKEDRKPLIRTIQQQIADTAHLLFIPPADQKSKSPSTLEKEIV